MGVLTAFRERLRHGSRTPVPSPAERDTALVCHCRRVTRGTVAAAIGSGEARSLSDLQRQTTACTRCFGCRFDLERMLRDTLRETYTPAPFLTRPEGVDARVVLPRRMYMPLFTGYAGHEIDTRVVIFNWADEADRDSRPVTARADLLALDGTRLDVWETVIEPRRSAVLDSREIIPDGLPDGGVGVMKLVVDAPQLSSLRPYFQLLSPTAITSTHEKTGPQDPGRKLIPRRYNFLFPIAPSDAPEEAYFFLTNTQVEPMDGQELVWRSEDGEEESLTLPSLELDQSACVGLHEAFPAIASGEGEGTVRLDPALHKVAGWMLRVDRERALWKVQHL